MSDGIGSSYVSDKFIALEMPEAGGKGVQCGLGELVGKYIGAVIGKTEKVDFGVMVVALLLGREYFFDQGCAFQPVAFEPTVTSVHSIQVAAGSLFRI